MAYGKAMVRGCQSEEGSVDEWRSYKALKPQWPSEDGERRACDMYVQCICTRDANPMWCEWERTCWRLCKYLYYNMCKVYSVLSWVDLRR